MSVPISPSNVNDDSPPPPGGLSLEEYNTNSVHNNGVDKVVSGRPIGTTLKRKAQVHALVVKATNEVTEMYNNAKMKYTDRGTISMVPNGTLHTIINRIKKKHKDLPSKFDVKYDLVRKRINRKNRGWPIYYRPSEPIFSWILDC